MTKSRKQVTPQKIDLNSPAPTSERVLAFLGLGLIALGVLAYLTNLITAMYVERDAFATGPGVIIGYLAYFSMPLGFTCIFILLIKSMRRRSKEREEQQGHK